MTGEKIRPAEIRPRRSVPYDPGTAEQPPGRDPAVYARKGYTKPMILSGKQTHIAYRCPGCGYSIFGYVGAFAKTHDLLKLKCQCGESELSMNFTDDGKVRLTVPCLFCRRPHHFTVSQSVFFGQERFLIACPYTHMDICFIGDKEKIGEELERSGKELEELFERLGEEEDEEGTREGPTPEELLPDAQIYDIIRFVVKELEADGKIECPCGEGPYETDITEDGVRVYCANCGAEHVFKADSVQAAEAFLQCEGLRLTYEP